MTTATAFLNAARADLGYVEGPNNFTKFGVWYGGNASSPFAHASWCDMAVSYWAAKAGGADIIGNFAYTPAHAAWFQERANNRRWSSVPVRGAVVFYNFPGDGLNRVQHVGIVESFTSTHIVTIEGNTSAGTKGSQSNGDGVYRRQRSRLLTTVGGSVVGYGIPNFTPEVKAPVKIEWMPSGLRYYKVGSRMMRVGMKGTDIAWLQHQLGFATLTEATATDKKAGKVIDGDFGVATETEVKARQKKWFPKDKRQWDGIAGPLTLRRVRAL